MRKYFAAAAVVVIILGLGAAYGPFTLPYDRPNSDLSGDAAVPPSGKTIAERFKLSQSSETFKIVQAAERLPRIYEATINPPDVKVGDIQRFEIVVGGPDPIVSVEAHMELDHGPRVVPLKFKTEVAVKDMAPNPYYVDKNGKLAVAKDGPKIAMIANAEAYPKLKYVGEWKVEDTHVAMYRTTLIVKDAAGRVNDVTLEWSDAVCDISMSGNWTSTADCSLAHDDGTDSGDITLGSLDDITLGSYNLGFTGSITIGTGSLIITTGDVLQGTYLWVYDDDNDGYIDDTMSITAQTSDPGTNWERKATRTAWGDCLDTDADVYRDVSGIAYDEDQDGFYTGSSGTQCVGTSSSVNQRVSGQATTYYIGTSSAATWITAANANGGSDCANRDTDIFQTLTAGTDSDHDGYISGSGSSQCIGETYYLAQIYPLPDKYYYRDASGTYTWLTTASADGTNDCNEADGDEQVTSGATGRDNDADGLVQEAALHSECVGVSYVVVSGREYYQDSSGCYYWIRGFMATGYNDAADGTTCRCYDGSDGGGPAEC